MSNVRRVVLSMEEVRLKKNRESARRMKEYRNRIALCPVKTKKYSVKDKKRKAEDRLYDSLTDDSEIKKIKREKEKIRKRKQRMTKPKGLTDKIADRLQQTFATNARLRKKGQRDRDKLRDEIGALSRMMGRSRSEGKVRGEEVDDEVDEEVDEEEDEEVDEEEDEEVDEEEDKEEEVRAKPSVARAIWNNLSPNTKRRTKLNLKLTNPVSTYAVRKEIGVNLSNDISPRNMEKTELCKAVEEFFSREDVTRVCPDKDKIAINPSNKHEKQQIRYRGCSLNCLHQKFAAETNDCSLSSFRRYVPYYVKKPASPSDWGTCICETCLNPELKFERLVQMKVLTSNDFESLTSEEKISSFIKDVKELRDNKPYLAQLKVKHVNFMEWKKVENPYLSKSGKKGNKITRNVPDSLPMVQFLDRFLLELGILKDHLFRVHQQFKRFKEARIAAQDSGGATATIHLDWSENAKLVQARAARSAHYNEDQISIQCMRVWNGADEYSIVSLSDSTDHAAEAGWASLEPVLLQLLSNGVKHINIVSDSPISQFRNKSIYYFMKDFVSREDNNASLTWIYLEAGHGKGLPDGIGATSKRGIDSLLVSRPEISMYDVDTLMNNGYEAFVPSLTVLKHTKGDIEAMKNRLPKNLIPAPNTFKIHEVGTINVGVSTKLYSKEHSSQKEFMFFEIEDSGKRFLMKPKKTMVPVKSEKSDTESGSETEKSSSDSQSDSENSDSDNDDDKQIAVSERDAGVKTSKNQEEKEDGEISFQSLKVDDFVKLKRGTWVVVQYKNLQYPGVIVQRDGLKLKPNCMTPANSKPGQWIWPRKKDNKSWFPSDRVLCRLAPPRENEDGTFSFRGWP